MSGLHDLSAAELLRGYDIGAFTPVDVITDVLAQIRRWEPHLRATWALDESAALAQAEASAQRWRTRIGLGALDGVPVTIKENIATQGLAVPLGTAATPLIPALQDAPPAARLREAGAVLVSKTTMPDFGMLSSGLSSFHALTRNPWNLALNPGGSSAGAGAAAAAGYGPLHLGTDIGGSIRLPAAWCGVVGFKPSLGRVPIYPPYIGRVAGPLTRTVEDAALAMGFLSRPDPRDSMSLPFQALAWGDLERDLRGLRIGLWLDAGCGLPVDAEVRQAVHHAAERFAKAGAEVTPIAPFFTRAHLDGIDRFFRIRAATEMAAMPPDARERALPFIRQWAEGGLGLTAEQGFIAFNQIFALREAAVAACAPFDAVLSPTAPIPAFGAELPCPTNDPALPFEHIAFTVPFNVSEQPAISINAGYTASGLPIGLQIIGPRHDDMGVLRLGRAWEMLRDAQAARPEAPTEA